MAEIWKDIPGFEGLYQVSDLGRVKSLDRIEHNKNGRILPIKDRIMATHSNGKGHIKLTLSKGSCRNKKYIHRLMAEVFVPNPNGYKLINHIDGNPSNNILSNIEWVSMRENVTHGLKKKNSRKKSSSYPGVHLNTVNTNKKWKAMLFANGRHNYLGNFYTEEEAHAAYQKALIEYGIDNKYAKVS